MIGNMSLDVWEKVKLFSYGELRVKKSISIDCLCVEEIAAIVSQTILEYGSDMTSMQITPTEIVFEIGKVRK